MDEKFEPYWHVFFGKNFGAHAIHIKNRFIYFIIDKIAFLMYQTQWNNLKIQYYEYIIFKVLIQI